jgi:N-terminal domain of anti-restriction factor ArdC
MMTMTTTTAVMTDLVYKTYDEWKKEGYHVVKGSKAVYIENQPMFSQFQVTERNFLYDEYFTYAHLND